MFEKWLQYCNKVFNRTLTILIALPRIDEIVGLKLGFRFLSDQVESTQN